MNVIAPSGAKIYNITGGKTLPQWLSNNKKKLLKNDVDFQKRIQLIQDFEFDGACQQVRVSKDGYYIAAVGTYPPRCKIYSTEDLSMKCQRGMDSEVVQFDFLSDDYKKLVFLQNDRNIEVHAQWGAYYKLRIPKFGRDMIYDRTTAEVYCAAAGTDIYRLNLSTGQFQQPWKSSSVTGTNCIDQQQEHLLVAVGGDHGHVECFDIRQSRCVGDLNVKKQVGEQSITSVRFDPADPLKLAVGTDTGIVLLYDIRSSNPLVVRDHQYELPIVDIQFQNEFCISADQRICKVWDKSNGKPLVNMESESAINNIGLVPNTGLLFLPKQQDKIEIYYIPGLGVAPFWCSFLDNLTEELEDTPTIIYDDYKFISRQELDQLGLNKLIGTPYLRAYMHGFFMDARLYRKVHDATNPFGYKEYVQERIKQKREEQQQSRITKKKRPPKVNKSFHERYLQDLKADERFGAILENPEFQIDVNSEDYQRGVHRNNQETDNYDDDNDYNDHNDDHDNNDDKRTRKHHNSSFATTKKNKLQVFKKGSLPSTSQKVDIEKRETKTKLSLAYRLKMANKEKQFNKISKTPSRNLEISFTPSRPNRKKVASKKNHKQNK